MELHELGLSTRGEIAVALAMAPYGIFKEAGTVMAKASFLLEKQ
jgi:hypothetical protein